MPYTNLSDYLKTMLDKNLIDIDYYNVVWNNRSFLTWGKVINPENKKEYWLVWDYIPTDLSPQQTFLAHLEDSQNKVSNSTPEQKKWKGIPYKMNENDLMNKSNAKAVQSLIDNSKNISNNFINRQDVLDNIEKMASGGSVPVLLESPKITLTNETKR